MGQISASDYHKHRVEELFPLVLESYQSLASEYDVILIEGAGSPAEINLKAHDIVNMRMARAADAACLLVGDIDRGGVFASLFGTVALLDPEERRLLRGFIVNKFRGDISLLTPGIEMIAERIGLPCVGVVPHLRDLGLEEEDGVALEDRRTAARSWTHAGDRLKIGVIALPHMANFTDFDTLAAEPSVTLAYLDHSEDIPAADLLIVPGSKQTLDDLAWLRDRGFARAIQEFKGRAGIAGICGGMQMLGRSIDDPEGVENNGSARTAQGLGLLPISTTLARGKVTRVISGEVCAGTRLGRSLGTRELHGYEIHMGETVYAEGAEPFANVLRGGDTESRRDGVVGGSADRVAFGTYIHGLFSEDAFRHSFLAAARAACGLRPMDRRICSTAQREQRIDRLAEHVRRSLDMTLIRSWIS